MRRITACLVAAAIATVTLFGLASTAEAITGPSWRTASGSGIVRMERCDGNRLCGVITRVIGAPVANDARNPDPALRSRPLVGIRILSGFTPAGPGRWTGGRIYNPEDGRSYRSELRTLPNGNLEVKGCVGPVCQDQIWTPIR